MLESLDWINFFFKTATFKYILKTNYIRVWEKSTGKKAEQIN